MLRSGWSIMFTSGILMLLGYFFLGMNLWSVMIPVILFYWGSTFIWPNAFATAFTPFGDIAGYAGALYGFMQISGGAAFAALAAYLPDNDQLIFAFVIIITSLASWLSYEALVNPTMIQTKKT